jgi:hypothetical protein
MKTPPVVCPSPALLDQSFPRNVEELTRVAVALGTLGAMMSADDVRLLLTHAFEDLFLSFEWQRTQTPLLRDIHRMLALWFQQTHGVITIDLPDETVTPHPLPQGCSGDGLAEFWAQDVAKVLAAHNQCCLRDGPFIGVACDKAFAGEPLGSYENPQGLPVLPLVGPDNVKELAPAYEWRVSVDLLRKDVSFADAKKHVPLLGGRVQGATGSHYPVKFRGARTWVLDWNDDPVPDTFIRELVEITGYPFPVIKATLLTGVPVGPPEFRISQLICSCASRS